MYLKCLGATRSHDDKEESSCSIQPKLAVELLEAIPKENIPSTYIKLSHQTIPDSMMHSDKANIRCGKSFGQCLE